MSASSDPLPRFEKPPVIETVIGVHFRPPEKFTSVHQSLLWHRCFRERFPNVDERPPVEEVQERFGDQRLSAPGIRWQVSARPDAPRIWAASPSGENVIQIQRNALFANWLKTGNCATYRPYSDRRQEFAKQLEQLAGFLRDEELGQLEPTSWSVTYINHINYSGVQDIGPAVSGLLNPWTNQLSDQWLPSADMIALDYCFPMPETAGRLNVNLKPAVVLGSKEHVLLLELTARGQLKTKDTHSALQGIDMGHEWIVRGFASITRPEMHQAWGRIQ